MILSILDFKFGKINLRIQKLIKFKLNFCIFTQFSRLISLLKIVSLLKYLPFSVVKLTADIKKHFGFPQHQSVPNNK